MYTFFSNFIFIFIIVLYCIVLFCFRFEISHETVNQPRLISLKTFDLFSQFVLELEFKLCIHEPRYLFLLLTCCSQKFHYHHHHILEVSNYALYCIFATCFEIVNVSSDIKCHNASESK